MYSDYHLHTEFSDDSEYPIESLVQDAIQMGLEEICFTDHVDYESKRNLDPLLHAFIKEKPSPMSIILVILKQ